MRWILYVILYGFLGFLLERILNCTTIGCFDNSVLFGPVQPMYGIGVTVVIFAHEQLKIRRYPLLLHGIGLFGAAILATWASETVSGTLYERFYGSTLWDYQKTFTWWCNHPYSCVIPTTLFGILAACTVLTLHRFLDPLIRLIPWFIGAAIIGLFFLDVLMTYRTIIWP